MLWKLKNWYQDIKNWIMRLRYGYDWTDVYNFYYGFALRLNKKLCAEMMRQNLLVTNQVTDFQSKNFMELYRFNLLLENTFLSEHNLMGYFKIMLKGMDEYKYTEIEKVICQYGKQLGTLLPPTSLKDLALFAHNTLEKWLECGLNSHPETIAMSNWKKIIKRYSTMWGDIANTGVVKNEKQLYYFFRHLPNMWD